MFVFPHITLFPALYKPCISSPGVSVGVLHDSAHRSYPGLCRKHGHPGLLSSLGLIYVSACLFNSLHSSTVYRPYPDLCRLSVGLYMPTRYVSAVHCRLSLGLPGFPRSLNGSAICSSLQAFCRSPRFPKVSKCLCRLLYVYPSLLHVSSGL